MFSSASVALLRGMQVPKPLNEQVDEKWKFGIHVDSKDPTQIMKWVFDVLLALKYVIGVSRNGKWTTRHTK